MWDLAEKILTVSAAWVQAVGSIVALYVAFKVASRQARRDDRRREQEQAEWRLGLLTLALEAQHFLQHARIINDAESGQTYARTYDPAYPNRLIELLYNRLRSDNISVRDIAPTIRIIRAFKDGTDQITAKYAVLSAKQFPRGLPEHIRQHAEIIRTEIDAMMRDVPR